MFIYCNKTIVHVMKELYSVKAHLTISLLHVVVAIFGAVMNVVVCSENTGNKTTLQPENTDIIDRILSQDVLFFRFE